MDLTRRARPRASLRKTCQVVVYRLHLVQIMETMKIAVEGVKILWCLPIAGPLYRALAEDGELYCYDWTFRVATLDGRTFEHSSYVVRGAVENPEGFLVANYNHRNEAEVFCRRVEERGTINLQYWIEITGETFDLEDALKEEAARERLERGGY